jgi:GT2 family glycosyltransferase
MATIAPFSDKKHVVVAIPVRNEEAYIGPCLAALAGQTAPPDDIILLLNNCTDGSAAICHSWQNSMPNLRIVERRLTGRLANAGEARRLALEFALGMSEGGVLLTTDADAVVPPDWVANNLRHILQGAEAVCGRAAMDPDDAAALPARLHEDHATEERCLTALDELDHALNPDPHDPWPRHTQHSGASIAVTAAALRRAGGPPSVAAGEDRALVASLRAADGKIRHAPEIVVTVSGRLQGRAAGGMAETISRRLAWPDAWADEAVEPAIDAYRRALAKAGLRSVRAGEKSGQSLADDLLMSPSAIRWAQLHPYFGAAWNMVQRLSPVLHRRRVAVADLPKETRQAAHLCQQLAAEAWVSQAAE